MINIKKISKNYDRLAALKNVSFNVSQGELCGLVGLNGAGKTTLFKIIIGQIAADSGEILIEDQPVAFGDFKYKQQLGYAPETPALYDYLTGYEFLNFIGKVKQLSAGDCQMEAEKWLAFFKMDEKAQALIANYSQGMRRKISLSAALMGKPKLLLLDEATNGLDPETSYYFKNYLREYCDNGGTILFASHIIETLENLCERLIILNQGDILKKMQREAWEKLPQQANSLEQVFINLIQNASAESTH